MPCPAEPWPSRTQAVTRLPREPASEHSRARAAAYACPPEGAPLTRPGPVCARALAPLPSGANLPGQQPQLAAHRGAEERGARDPAAVRLGGARLGRRAVGQPGQHLRLLEGLQHGQGAWCAQRAPRSATPRPARPALLLSGAPGCALLRARWLGYGSAPEAAGGGCRIGAWPRPGGWVAGSALCAALLAASGAVLQGGQPQRTERAAARCA